LANNAEAIVSPVNPSKVLPCQVNEMGFSDFGDRMGCLVIRNSVIFA